MTDRILCADDPGVDSSSCVSYEDFPKRDGIRVFTLESDDECGLIPALCELAREREEAYTIIVDGFIVVSANVRNQELTENLCHLLLALNAREMTRGIKEFGFDDFPILDKSNKGYDTNYACLRHFGLSKKVNNKWSLTQLGRDFCCGEAVAFANIAVSGCNLVAVLPGTKNIRDIVSDSYLDRPLTELVGKDR